MSLRRWLRGAVAQRDGGVCVDCPRERGPWPYGEWHADHVLPLVMGGADDLDNIVTRCVPHHQAKTRTDGSQTARRRPTRRPARRTPLVAHRVEQFPGIDSRVPVVVWVPEVLRASVDAEVVITRSATVRSMLAAAMQARGVDVTADDL